MTRDIILDLSIVDFFEIIAKIKKDLKKQTLYKIHF